MIVALVGWPGVSDAVNLRGKVLRIGYSGSGSGQLQVADLYKVGRWVPVRIELDNSDGDQFQGTIEVRQPDRDGDIVIGSLEVMVRGRREFSLYVPAGGAEDPSMFAARSAEAAPFSVRVLDADGNLARLHDDTGQPVRLLEPAQQTVPISPQGLVVLDISFSPVGKLADLKTLERLREELYVVRASASELPEHEAGLEMVDVIIWDEPDPTANALSNEQSAALLEWVKRGGKLIVGVTKSWDVLSSSRFGEWLPARLQAPLSTSEPGLIVSLQSSGTDRGDRPLPSPLAYCKLTAAELHSQARPLVPRVPAAEAQILAADRVCARGRIILVPMSMRLLLDYTGKDTRFLERIVGVNRSATEHQNQMMWGGLNRGNTDLFSRLSARTAFQTMGGLYFGLALIFVAGYAALATGGLWWWLRRRGAARHSWVGFTAVALAASAVSFGAVQFVRLLGQGVQELTVVTMNEGSFEAVATCYYGYKTGTHTRVDLCVPRDWLKPADQPERRRPLKPLPPETQWGQQITFSAPQRYAAVAPLGELRSVPIRATLKQFQAEWTGTLGGRVTAGLRASQNEFTASSYIQNDLGVDLEDCYLFAELNRQVVYPIGMIKAGERVPLSLIAERLREQAKAQAGRRPLLDLGAEDQSSRTWAPPTLIAFHRQALEQLGVNVDYNARRRGDEPEQKTLSQLSSASSLSLLVLTTFDLLDDTALRSGGLEVERGPARELDRSADIQTDSAVLVGFSPKPGPTRLCWRPPNGRVDDFHPLQPRDSMVMYQVRLPVARE